MTEVVTANELRSGAVVYLAAEGRWVERLAAAAVAENEAALQRLSSLAAASVERCEVTAVYAFDVRIVDGRPEPISVRERLRAARAPSV